MSFLIWEACQCLQEQALVRFCELISWEGLRSSMGGSGAFWLRALEPHDPRAMLKVKADRISFLFLFFGPR